MRWLLALGLFALIFASTSADHYDTLGVSRTATQSQIRSAFQTLAKVWHPDKNTDPGAVDKYKDISQAYEVLSDPTKRNEYELSLRPGHSVSTRRTASPTDTVELTASNWDWNIRVANRGQMWIVLFCGESYKGCSQAFAEWEKAFQLVGPYCRMGRVNVDAQWSIVSNFGVRHVPSVYLVIDGDLRLLQTQITADSIYSFLRHSLPSPFKEIRSTDDWRRAFDWESRLKHVGVDAPERVQIVLFSDDRNIPVKWRYWSRQYSDDLVDWYFIHPSFAAKSLISHLSSSFGVSHTGVAILFPNPRESTDVVILADPDTNGRSEELTSAELEDWLKTGSVPKLAKLDASNFLQIVGNTHYTLVMAVDMSIGTTSGQLFGNSRLKRFVKMIEPMTTLWEQRRGTSLRDLQFTWFGTHKTSIAKTFGLTKEPTDGQLFLVDRRRWEYSMLPLDIDRDDISTFVNIILKHSQKQLPMKKVLHIPQSTDEQWSLAESLQAASSFGYPIIGIGIVIVMTTYVVWRTPASSKKPPTGQQAKSGTKSAKDSSSSTSSNASEQAKSSSKPATDVPENSDFFEITLPSWIELTGSNYETTLSKENFTMILFPPLTQKKEAGRWQQQVKIVCESLSTDSVSLTWVHPKTQLPYTKFWLRHCEAYLSADEPDNGPGRVFGILIRQKSQKFMIFAGEEQNSSLEAEYLASWVQKVLEGQTAWMDIPTDSPDLS